MLYLKLFTIFFLLSSSLVNAEKTPSDVNLVDVNTTKETQIQVHFSELFRNELDSIALLHDTAFVYVPTEVIDALVFLKKTHTPEIEEYNNFEQTIFDGFSITQFDDANYGIKAAIAALNNYETILKDADMEKLRSVFQNYSDELSDKRAIITIEANRETKNYKVRCPLLLTKYLNAASTPMRGIIDAQNKENEFKFILCGEVI